MIKELTLRRDRDEEVLGIREKRRGYRETNSRHPSPSGQRDGTPSTAEELTNAC